MTDKPIYTYMLEDRGSSYVVFKDDEPVNPQELCTHLNALEQREKRFGKALNTIAFVLTDEPAELKLDKGEFDKAQLLACVGIATRALAAEDDLDKLTTQQKPTEEAMEEASMTEEPIETTSVFMWPFAMTDEEATAWSALSDRVRKHLYTERVALELRVEGLERANTLAKSFLSTEEWLKVGRVLAGETDD